LDQRWWSHDSPLAAHLSDLHFVPLAKEPFVWSTDVNGAFLDLFKSKTAKHSDWKAGGAALAYFLRQYPRRSINVISHSHGLQVVLYACAEYGLRINSLIDISGPVRDDMLDVAAKARKNIGYWTHVHSGKSDRTQWFGEMFDGAFGIVRKHPYADLNVYTPNLGHSKILNDPAKFSDWSSLIVPAFTVQGPGKFPYGRP
jgi:hypothetical protein